MDGGVIVLVFAGTVLLAWWYFGSQHRHEMIENDKKWKKEIDWYKNEINQLNREIDRLRSNSKNRP